MSSARQNLDFVLIRSGQFNRSEIAVLCFINTFSGFCAPKSLKIMATQMQTSERTLRRTIKILCAKGMLIKRYRCFKRLHLEIVPLAAQKALRGMGMMKTLVSKGLKRLRKRSDRPNRTDLIRPSVAEPNTEQNLKNKTLPENQIFELKSVFEGEKDPVSEMLSQFWAFREARNMN